MKQIPFQIIVTVPGATTRIGTQHESYRLKTGVTTIPVLQTNERTYIPESPAILKHLCESYGWHDFYPSYQQDHHRLAMIDAYLHWHHAHTRRNMSKQLMPYVRPGLAQFPNATGKTSKLAERHIHETLTSLNDFWLANGDATNNNAWIASSSSSTSSTTTPTCTIADLLAYEELVPLTMTGLLPGLVSSSNHNNNDDIDNDTNSMPVLPPDEQRSYYPAVAAWMDRMRTLPYHDAIHASIAALGTLTPPDMTTTTEKEHTVKMNQLVGTATKIGLQAIQAAQDTYYTPKPLDVE
jgi:glutathione S-transferase